jgi:enoyl-CoA hydratase/carnithine racemase
MAEALFSDANMDALMSGKCPDGFDTEDKNVARQLKQMSRAAPVSVRIANQLIQTAVETGSDLGEGLQSELDQLEAIFSTKDAAEGLGALVEGRRPEYVGS